VNNLREIQALHRLSPHPNVIRLIEVLYDGPTGRLALVFELMDMNVYELIRGRRHYVAEDRVCAYMYQLVKAMDHMHRNGIFHRDIKPENILLADEVLKLADFGSCRGIYSKQPYTEYISTRWYRAPECLLTDGYYNYKMDMWGVGCVFFELVALYPLFPGANEVDQIAKIHAVIGTPPPALLAKMKQRSSHADAFAFAAVAGPGIAPLIAHAAPDCIDLIASLLRYDPDARLSARQALRHPYFRELRAQDKRQQAALLAAQGGGAQGSTPPGDVRASPATDSTRGRDRDRAPPAPPVPQPVARRASVAARRSSGGVEPPPPPPPVPPAAVARQPPASLAPPGLPRSKPPAAGVSLKGAAAARMAAPALTVRGAIVREPPPPPPRRENSKLGPAAAPPRAVHRGAPKAYVSPYSVRGIAAAAAAAAAGRS